MFFLFGIKPVIKKIGITKKYRCTRCSNVTNWEVYESRSWFTLFFIPLIPMKTEYYERCSVCGGYNQLSREEAEACRAIE